MIGQSPIGRLHQVGWNEAVSLISDRARAIITDPEWLAKRDVQLRAEEHLLGFNAGFEGAERAAFERERQWVKDRTEILESLRWAYAHAQCDEEATTGEQEDFGDLKAKAWDVLEKWK